MSDRRSLEARIVRRVQRLLGDRPTVAEAQASLAWDDAQRVIYERSTTQTRIHDDHHALRREVFGQRPAEGMILEFGVFRGQSLNAFAEQARAEGDGRTLHGFDSFEGFSEEWTGVEGAFPKDRFDLAGGRPTVASNCALVDGFVEQTLPDFLREHEDDVAFIHIDTDTYSPARTVLACCRPRLKAGSIVLFDELLGYPNWRSHEYRALQESLHDDEYTFLGFATSSPRARLIKAAIRIDRDLKDRPAPV